MILPDMLPHPVWDPGSPWSGVLVVVLYSYPALMWAWEWGRVGRGRQSQ